MEDFQKISTLLDIILKASTAGPQFNWLIEKARVELMLMKEGNIIPFPETPVQAPESPIERFRR